MGNPIRTAGNQIDRRSAVQRELGGIHDGFEFDGSFVEQHDQLEPPPRPTSPLMAATH